MILRVKDNKPIEIGTPLQDLPRLASDQTIDLSQREFLSQGLKRSRGQDHIADRTDLNDEDVHRLHQFLIDLNGLAGHMVQSKFFPDFLFGIDRDLSRQLPAFNNSWNPLANGVRV